MKFNAMKFNVLKLNVLKLNALKLVACCAALLLTSLSLSANAYHVHDLREFNQHLLSDEWVSWTYNLSDYGFDPARDVISGQIILVLSLRGFSGEPCENYDAQPFIFGAIGLSRIYGRACEDLVLNDVAYFEDGAMTVGLKTDAEADFRFASLDFDIVPGPHLIPEPHSLWLWGTALAGLAARRRLLMAGKVTGRKS